MDYSKISPQIDELQILIKNLICNINKNLINSINFSNIGPYKKT